LGLKASYATYELPFGPGKAFLNSNSLLNRTLLGGWQVNGIFVGQSGLPFTATTSGTATKNRRIREPRQRRSRGTPVSGKEVGESMV
jgi:hypothetical protein